jgi:hypothetical protein
MMGSKRRSFMVAISLVFLLALAFGVGSSTASATTSSTTGPSSAFTQTKTISRLNQVGGSNVTVDTRTVTLNVSQTSGLQGRQEIHVSWTGAHPTGGIVSDENSQQAEYEEYPFVLLECRGIDSASAPAGEQLSPDTCWTQTWSEHYQDSFSSEYPPYRLDQYASTTPDTPGPAIVGAPSPMPTNCTKNYDETAPVQYWVPFDSALGTVYPGGNAGCAGEAPESDDDGGSALPSNETFGVTTPPNAAGVTTGSANFDVFTTAENPDLGCSTTVPCDLVAVPIMGVSCLDTPGDTNPDVEACEQTGAFAPGSVDPDPSQPGEDLTVSGALWWTPSNWRNRISVPLQFAVPADACSVVSSPTNNVIDIYGSELMIQATSQWEPYFCLDPKSTFSFIHVKTGEPQARNLVASGTAEAAFTSYAQPGGYGKPVVNAPVAATGFSISYAIDGANGAPYTTLKLTPLLLAKLLTESYPGDLFLKQADPSAFANSPLNITMDPEFQALNPGIAANPSADFDPGAVLIAMSGDSDVMEALTSYINADPTARAWLNGAPDPNSDGMTVNPAYKGIQLPLDTWPLSSTFIPTADYAADENNNPCLYNSPVPYQPLVAAPLATLESISESIQYDQPNSTVNCYQPNPGSDLGEKLVTNGRQAPGDRFVIGITPLGDNQRYLLQSAALQTTPGTFVAPSNASIQAAANLLTYDPSSGTWPIPYGEFQQPAGATAYPGTMLVYAAIPTSGLPATDATDYGQFLQFAATTGQEVGVGTGQLPAGYLPLTAADGLGPEAQYTLEAATDVAAQNGLIPPQTAAPAPTTGASPVASATPPTQFLEPSNTLDDTLPLTTDTASPTAAHQVTPAVRLKVKYIHPGSAVAATLWTGGPIVILVLALALAGVLGIPALFALGRRRGRW